MPNEVIESMNRPHVNPHLSTADVLGALRASGKPLHEWGRAIDGTPLLAARTGGDKRPAIFITAGSHAPETAGVHAALTLLRSLETDHETHILPLRDPLGFDGVNACLSCAAGETVGVPTHDAVLDYLTARGRLLWDDGHSRIFKLGAFGFMWRPATDGIDSMMRMTSGMVELMRDDPGAVRPLWGARVMLLCAMRNIEGSGELQRCLHGVISERGEWMHLNRFFGRDDAPPEVAAVDRLVRSIQPGLTCDLHEGNGVGFWMPMRRPRDNPERVFDMTKAFFDEITSRRYPVATYENVVATDYNYGKNYPSQWWVPEPRLPGMIWADGLLRNQGYNLIDYAGLFGIGYGTEAPMEQPLAVRADGIVHGIGAAIRVWERTQ